MLTQKPQLFNNKLYNLSANNSVFFGKEKSWFKAGSTTKKNSQPLRKNIFAIKLNKSLFPFLMILVGVSIFWAQPASAVVKYWIGSAGGSFTADANWSLSSGGANNTTAPNLNDTATFTSGGNTNCTISSDVTIRGLDMQSTYSQTLTINSGVKVTVKDQGWTVSAGTISASGSTVEFQPGLTITGTQTLGNVIINNTSASAATLIVASGTTLNVAGTLTFDSTGTGATTINTGTIAAQGNITVADSFDYGQDETHNSTATLLINGTGTQVFSGSATQTAGNLPKVNINKASGALTISGTLRTLSDWTFTSVGSGSLSATGTVSFGPAANGSTTITGSHTLNNVTIDSNQTTNNTLTIASGTTLTAAGNLLIDNTSSGTLTVNTGTLIVQGNLTTTSDLAVASTSPITLTGTNSQTINAVNMTAGTFTVNKSSGTATLAANLSANSSGQNLTITSGTLDLAGFNLTVNSTLTVSSGGTLQLQGGETLTASTKTINSGSTVIYNGSGSYTGFAAGNSYDNLTFNGSGTWTSNFALTTVTNNLTMTSGTLNGTDDITVNGGGVTGDGTISMTGGTFLVDGTGNFGGATAWTFYNLTFGDGSGVTTTTATGAGAITVSKRMLVAASQTLDAGSKTWNLTGSDTSASTLAIDSQESAATGHNSATSPLTWSFNNVAGTTLVCGFVMGAATSASISGTPTYNGVNMKQVDGHIWNSGGAAIYLYYLNSPATGSNTVSVSATFSGANPQIIGGCISFTGLGSFGTPAFAKQDVSSSTTATVTVTGTTSGNKVIDVVGTGSGVTSATSPSVLSWKKNVNALTATNNAAQSYQSAGGSITMAYTVVSDFWAINAVEAKITPASVPLTVNGTFTANASTVNFKGTAASTIAAVTYNNVAFIPASGSPTYTLGSASSQTINAANFTIGDGTNAVSVNHATFDPTLNISGNFLIAANAGTFTKSDLPVTITFKPTGAKTWTDNTAQDIGVVVIGSGSSTPKITLGSNAKATTVTINASHELDLSSFTLSLIGTSTPFTVSGTFTPSTGTISYIPASSSSITVAGTTYHHVTFNSSSTTFTLGGNTTTDSGGNLTLTAGTLQLSTLDLTVNGTASISGTLNDNSATGTNIFVGAVTINSGGVWTETNNPAFTFRGGLTNNSSSGFTSGTGIYTFDTNAQTISGSQSFAIINLTNNVTTSTGLTFSGAQPTVTTLTQGTNAQLTYSGSMPSITTLTATASGNTVSYTSTAGAQTVKSTTYVNLTINKSGQTATLGGDTTANGNLTITLGTLDVDNTNNYSLTVKGDWTNNGTFTARTGLVTFNGTGTQNINSNNTWYRLSVTTSTARTVNFESSKTQTIAANGTLTFTGASGQLLTLAPKTAATTWALTVNNTGVTQAVTYVNPSYSDASGGATIVANDGTSTNGGNNTNWNLNTAPSINSGPSDNGALVSPTNVGSNVTFTATATDPESNNYFLAICKTNAITANNNAVPTCTGGNWCISSSTVSGSQTSCNYATQSGDAESNAWYAFACDNTNFSVCSSFSQGLGNNGSPFEVNHIPTFTAISNTSGSISVGSSVTFTTTASDPDASSTVTLYVCKSNDFTGTACGSGGELCHSSATASNPTCSYTILSSDASGSQTYYGNIIDNHNFSSASNPRSSTFTVASAASTSNGGGVSSGGSGPPTVSILINDGQASTDSLDVILKLVAESNIVKMSISNSPDFSNVAEEPYVPTKNWKLTEGNGQKTVYVKFFNNYGAVSNIVSDNIDYKAKVTIIKEISQLGQKVVDIGSKIGGLFIPKPKPVEIPPIEKIVPIVPKETPEVFKGWDLMTTKPIGIFNMSSVPSDIVFFADKFPQFNKLLQDVGINKLNDVKKLNSVQVTLPGFTQMALVKPDITSGSLPSLRGIPLFDLTFGEKGKVPTDIIFAKTGNELIDYNTNLSFDDKGNANQKITTIVGKPLELLIKPSKPVKNVTGFLVLRQKTAARNDLLPPNYTKPKLAYLYKYLTASLTSPQQDKAAPQNIQTELLLQKFEYAENKDGFYIAKLNNPIIEGNYEIITVMEYKDISLAPKQIRLINVVDPEGYIYSQLPEGRLRIMGATVLLYWLNPETKKYEMWPANKFLQTNPVITNDTGKYSFLTPEGLYYLEVNAPNYINYKSDVFSVIKGSIGIHMDIELKKKTFLPAWLDWKFWIFVLLGCQLLFMVYSFFNKKRSST